MKDPLLSLAEYAMMPAREAAACMFSVGTCSTRQGSAQLAERSTAKQIVQELSVLVFSAVQNKLTGVCCAWVKPIRTC